MRVRAARIGFAPSVGEVGALEAHRARRRRRELHDRPTGGRLAAAGLADDAERLAAAHVEADPGDGADDQPGAPEREVDHEVLDAQHDVVADRAEVGVAGAGHQPLSAGAVGPAGATCVAPTVLGRADRVPAGVLVIGCLGRHERWLLDVAAVAGVGAAWRERDSPAAASTRSGGRPGDRRRRGCGRRLERRDALEQRLGVGHLHVREQRPGRGPLDDHARRTSRRSRRCGWPPRRGRG